MAMRRTKSGTPVQWSPDDVGKIHYCHYWRTYSLILAVDGRTVTELDAFADINQHNGNGAKMRTHMTALDHRDKLMTVAEFHRDVIKAGKLPE